MNTRIAAAALAGMLAVAGYAAWGRAAPATPARPTATPARPSATPARPAATSAAPAATSAAPAPAGAIAVTAREFLYEPNKLTAKAGDVTFAVKNAGVVEHDFVIEDKAKKQMAQANPFAPGKTMQVKVKLAAGDYAVFCSIPGHREAGMAATLRVTP